MWSSNCMGIQSCRKPWPSELSLALIPGVLGLADGPHAPRPVANALPRVGGDREGAARHRQLTLPDAHLGVATHVLLHAAVAADEGAGLFEGVDGAGEGEVGGRGPTRWART